MQETLRQRIEQLKQQHAQGQKMLDNLNREILMIVGGINEATGMLNHLIGEEKKAAEAKAKEEATKNKVKKKAVQKTKAPVAAPVKEAA